MNGLRYFWQAHNGTIILTVSLILFFAVLYLLRNVLLPFMVGVVIAYILLPLVTFVERRLPGPAAWAGAKRLFSVIVVLVLVAGFLGGIGFYVVTTTIDSVNKIVENAPHFLSSAFQTIQGWLNSIYRYLPPSVSEQLGAMAGNLGATVGNVLRTIFQGAVTFLPSTINYVVGFGALPVFLFYLMKDYDYLLSRFYSWLSPSAARHARGVMAILNDVLGNYIRAQMVMALFIGVFVLTGLFIIGAPFAVGLGAIAGLTELIPILGPWIGGIIGILVILAAEPGKVIPAIIVYAVVQVSENMLLVPRIHGRFQRIHPGIAIILVVVGAYLAGFWGLILAVPLASTVVRLYQYVIRSVDEERSRQSSRSG